MTVKAKATISVEIECNSEWSDETTVHEVKRQAVIDAKNELERMSQGSEFQISMVGEPDITIVSF